MQSGSIASSSLTNAQTQPLKRTHALAAKLNCSISTMLSCLRAKSVKEILEASKALPFPVAPAFEDDSVLPFKSGVEALKGGHFNADIDLLYGVNRDEGSLVVAMLFPELSSNETILTRELVKKYILKMHTASPYAGEVADFYLKDLKVEDESNQDKLR